MSAPEILATEVPARRSLRGFYLADQRGAIAVDGSLLDHVSGDHAYASAWRSPACELLQCWRAEVLRLVPLALRRCFRHGEQRPAGEETYPLEGAELRAAKDAAWAIEVQKRPAVATGYRLVSLETCAATPAIAAARAFLEDDSFLQAGVVLEGAVGCGKTTALVAVYRELVLDDLRARGSANDVEFFTFPGLIRALLDEEQRDDVLDDCRHTPVLIVDDVGSSYLKRDGLVVGLVEELVVSREAEHLATLFSTNLAPKVFGSQFGERVLDRLKGRWGRWLKLPGGSLRRKPS